MSAADIEEALSRGAGMASGGDPRSVEVLQSAAQSSSANISAMGAGRLLLAGPDAMPVSGSLREATQQAARAHLAWGEAAIRFAQRDAGIAALARAYRLAGPNRAGTNRLSRDSLNALNTALREGLPQVAADDTLDTLASLALWKPRRFAFDLPPGALGPSLSSAGAASSQATPRVELLITQGKVFPPELMAQRGDKSVVAPLYRMVDDDALPPVLRLGYMVAGYQKQSSGPNAGLWQMQARVFYPHPLFTRQSRDDRPRAEALCAQFLRVRALQAAALGLSNPYQRDRITRDTVTNLWMSEVSALWPADDDDPDTAEARGARMPKVNTKSPVARPVEIAETPLSMPWLAAAQMSSTPGDIFFFRSGQARGEAEWLREIAHEYGHVSLAPAGIFRPPLEPFGNGKMGETLAMMWAAASPQSFDASAFVTSQAAPPAQAQAVAAAMATRPAGEAEASGGSASGMRVAALAEVAREAVPTLRLWSAQGPGSPLRREGGENGLKYLQGFCVWAERVYGAPTLGAAMKPALDRSAYSWRVNARIGPTTTDALIANWETAMLLALKGGSRVAMWLPGALERLPRNVPATQLVNRAPLSLRAGESVATRLFVPVDARTLHVEVRGVPASASAEALRVEGWRARPAEGGAIEVDVSGRSGWQRFVWTARAPVTIGAAWLGK